MTILTFFLKNLTEQAGVLESDPALSPREHDVQSTYQELCSYRDQQISGLHFFEYCCKAIRHVELAIVDVSMLLFLPAVAVSYCHLIDQARARFPDHDQRFTARWNRARSARHAGDQRVPTRMPVRTDRERHQLATEAHARVRFDTSRPAVFDTSMRPRRAPP